MRKIYTTKRRGQKSGLNLCVLKFPLLFLCFSSLTSDLCGQITKSITGFRAPKLDPSIDKVDLTPLWDLAQQRSAELPEAELKTLVWSNFLFLFYNKLNKDRFLATPKPNLVVEKIVGVLNLNARVGLLIEEAQRSSKREASWRKKAQLVSEIYRSARKLRSTFSQYFVDEGSTTYRIKLARMTEKPIQFRYCLSQLNHINMSLTRELDRYFFNPAPGLVRLSEYQSSSIGVLCESLVKLSVFTKKVIRN